MKKLSPATVVAFSLFAKGSRQKRYFCGAVICLFLCSALGFSACRTLSTQNVDPSSGEVSGMLYYLPIGKITIKGEFTDTSPEKQKKPGEASTTEKSDGDKVAELSVSKGKPDGNGGGGTDQAPGGSTTISAGQLTITLTPEVEADETVGVYYAMPVSNPWYEDEVKMIVNAKHLLTTGNVTTEDKTVEIVGTLASIARQAITLAKETPKKELPPPFHFTFHPSNADEVGIVKAALSSYNRDIDFDVQQLPLPRHEGIIDNKGTVRQKGKPLGEDGLLFRAAVSYKVSLKYPKTSDQPRTIDSTQQFIMPDPTRLYEIKYNRMAFVKKVKDTGFTDGMLTEFHQRVPSPILGFLGIPKAILQAIVPIPGAPAANGSGSTSGTSAPKS
jgi:hypothetical protein